MSTAQLKHKHHFKKVTLEELYSLGWVYTESTRAKQIAIATTCEKLSYELLQATIQALIESNIKVIYLGELPLDFAIAATTRHKLKSLLYFSNQNYNNSKEFGLDIYDSLATGVIDYHGLTSSKKAYLDHDVPLDTFLKDNYAEIYGSYLLKSLGDLNKSVKIAIDCGNSSTGKYIVNTLQKCSKITVVPLHVEADKDYPHHFPEPSFRINTAELREVVTAEHCDFGVTISNCGTRIKLIDNAGREVLASKLNHLLLDWAINKFPGRKVVASPEYRRIYDSAKVAIATDKDVMNSCESLAAAVGLTAEGEYCFGVTHYAPSALAAILSIAQLAETGSLVTHLEKVSTDQYSLEPILLKLSPTSNGVQLVAKLKQVYPQSCDCYDGLDISFDNKRAFLNQKQVLFIEAVTKEEAESFKSELITNIKDLATETEQEELLLPPEIWQLSPRQRVELLLQNIYYSWNRHSHSPTHPLYSDNWIHNPTAYKLIREMSDDDFAKFWSHNRDWVHLQLRHLSIYLSQESYFQKLSNSHHELAKLVERPIAYFSLEYGLSDWLQIYSGGLGVLAGDTLKQASDTGIPLIGVGLFYSYGYFHQELGEDGWQKEVYREQNIADYPFDPALTPDGEVAEIAINILDHQVFARAFVLQVGRTKLILLDTNYERNKDEADRLISGHLYGGDKDTRIRQEILLGIGGYQMLLKMGTDPSICHMNEGHSAFVAISIIERLMRELQINFGSARMRAKEMLVFTNHTLKPAGNDTFSYELCQKYLTSYANKLSIRFEELYALGFDQLNPNGEFSMTLAAMNSSKLANAVSRIHSRAAENLWPNHKLIPITNGVHMPTWVARPIHQLLDQYATEDWHEPYSIKEFSSVMAIPKQSLWRVHQELKQLLVNQLNAHLGIDLKLDVLTLSWFRRFAAYKRPDLVVSDINRIKQLANSDRPIQILIGGKAHPRDQQGKELIQRIYRELQAPELKNKVVFIPGYNWRIAKMLVAGSDVWINTPQKFEEACGTSGMKASANGVLQLTTLDGWTDEVDWENMGWTLPDHNSENFYNTIAEKIVPLYYNREGLEYPPIWVDWMLRTIEMAVSRFSSERQMNDYLRELYLPMSRDQ